MTTTRQILLTVSFSEDQVSELRTLAPGFEVVSRTTIDEQTLADTDWQSVEILYTFRTLPSPEQALNLRWIQFHLAGIEEQLAQPILQKEGLQATTLSGANAPQVAEHALALMLACSHNIPGMLADQHEKYWAPDRLDRFVPNELLNSTVGIVGYGSIGQKLAYLLQPFEITILASKRNLMGETQTNFQIDEHADPHGKLVRRLYPPQALRSMFKACDFIVITVPLTQETKGMIGAKQLAALKETAFLIDVSRGGVVDHAALADALSKKQFAGAALDVFPEEPLPVDSPLWELPNVIVSPHVAGLSPHYKNRAFVLFKENLRRYLAEEPLLNKIDLDRGY